MSKKGGRKSNAQNPLEIRIEAVSVPARMGPQKYLKSLLNYIRRGEELPRGLEVDIHWRNPHTKKGRSKHWQADEFQNAIAESSSGFGDVVARVLLKQLNRR